MSSSLKRPHPMKLVLLSDSEDEDDGDSAPPSDPPSATGGASDSDCNCTDNGGGEEELKQVPKGNSQCSGKTEDEVTSENLQKLSDLYYSAIHDTSLSTSTVVHIRDTKEIAEKSPHNWVANKLVDLEMRILNLTKYPSAEAVQTKYPSARAVPDKRSLEFIKPPPNKKIPHDTYFSETTEKGTPECTENGSSENTEKDNKITCTDCGFEFNEKREHYSLVHRMEGSECKYCKFSLGRSKCSGFIMSVHQRPPGKLLCIQCGEFFHQKSVLSRHLILHSDESDLQCRVCAEKFANCSRLKAHITASRSCSRPSCLQPCTSNNRGASKPIGFKSNDQRLLAQLFSRNISRLVERKKSSGICPLYKNPAVLEDAVDRELRDYFKKQRQQFEPSKHRKEGLKSREKNLERNREKTCFIIHPSLAKDLKDILEELSSPLHLEGNPEMNVITRELLPIEKCQFGNLLRACDVTRYECKSPTTNDDKTSSSGNGDAAEAPTADEPVHSREVRDVIRKWEAELETQKCKILNVRHHLKKIRTCLDNDRLHYVEFRSLWNKTWECEGNILDGWKAPQDLPDKEFAQTTELGEPSFSPIEVEFPRAEDIVTKQWLKDIIHDLATNIFQLSAMHNILVQHIEPRLDSLKNVRRIIRQNTKMLEKVPQAADTSIEPPEFNGAVPSTKCDEPQNCSESNKQERSSAEDVKLESSEPRFVDEMIPGPDLMTKQEETTPEAEEFPGRNQPTPLEWQTAVGEDNPERDVHSAERTNREEGINNEVETSNSQQEFISPNVDDSVPTEAAQIQSSDVGHAAEIGSHGIHVTNSDHAELVDLSSDEEGELLAVNQEHSKLLANATRLTITECSVEGDDLFPEVLDLDFFSPTKLSAEPIQL